MCCKRLIICNRRDECDSETCVHCHPHSDISHSINFSECDYGYCKTIHGDVECLQITENVKEG